MQAHHSVASQNDERIASIEAKINTRTAKLWGITREELDEM